MPRHHVSTARSIGPSSHVPRPRSRLWTAFFGFPSTGQIRRTEARCLGSKRHRPGQSSSWSSHKSVASRARRPLPARSPCSPHRTWRHRRPAPSPHQMARRTHCQTMALRCALVGKIAIRHRAPSAANSDVSDRTRRVKDVNERGCDYCADHANMYFGHVHQLRLGEKRHKLLLECPRCGWLYEASPTGPPDAIHLTPAQAAERFHD